jgi:hypothetical protein
MDEVVDQHRHLDPIPNLATPYRCGCLVHVHPGRGESIHRHPCPEHPGFHDHVPAPIAHPADHHPIGSAVEWSEAEADLAAYYDESALD